MQGVRLKWKQKREAELMPIEAFSLGQPEIPDRNSIAAAVFAEPTKGCSLHLSKHDLAMIFFTFSS
jgi:hypothetical protein